MKSRLEYLPTAFAVSGFLAVSFAVCVAWDAVFPGCGLCGAHGRQAT